MSIPFSQLALAALAHVSRKLHEHFHEHREAGRIGPDQLSLSGGEPV